MIALALQRDYMLEGPTGTNGIKQMLVRELGGGELLQDFFSTVTRAIFKLSPGESQKARAPLLKLH